MTLLFSPLANAGEDKWSFTGKSLSKPSTPVMAGVKAKNGEASIFITCPDRSQDWRFLLVFQGSQEDYKDVYVYATWPSDDDLNSLVGLPNFVNNNVVANLKPASNKAARSFIHTVVTAEKELALTVARTTYSNEKLNILSTHDLTFPTDGARDIVPKLFQVCGTPDFYKDS